MSRKISFVLPSAKGATKLKVKKRRRGGRRGNKKVVVSVYRES